MPPGLVLTVNAHAQKAYRLGFGKTVSKTNLARANENRDWCMYQDFAYHLIAEARKVCIADAQSQFSFFNSVYSFDSTTIIAAGNILKRSDASNSMMRNKIEHSYS